MTLWAIKLDLSAASSDHVPPLPADRERRRPRLRRACGMSPRTDGWHLARHESWYLVRNGITVAIVFCRPAGWECWDFLDSSSKGIYLTKEAAQKAAEESTK